MLHFLFPLRISSYPKFAFKRVHFDYCDRLFVARVLLTIDSLKLGYLLIVNIIVDLWPDCILDMLVCRMELKHKQ